MYKRRISQPVWKQRGFGVHRWICIRYPGPKSRICNGSTLAHPLLRNLREFLLHGRWWMASIFWDSQGIIIVDYFEEGPMINGAYYAELRWLCQDIVKKRRGKVTWGVLLLQDNATAHTSQVAMAAATKCIFKVFPHPLYSPDLAPCDFYLFPNLKTYLHGRNFGSNGGVIVLCFVEQGRRLLFWKDAFDEYLRDQ